MFRAVPKITVPAEFVGSPARMADVPKDANPFSGLEESFGVTSSTPGVRDLAETAIDQLERQVAVTCLYQQAPRQFRDIGELARIDFGSVMRPRVGSEGMFYVAAHDGTMVLSKDPAPEAMRKMEVLGGFGAPVQGRLETIRAAQANLDAEHCKIIDQIVDCPRGGIIFETGAGSDYGRMRTLHRHAIEREGSLVCHDIAPAAARAALDNVEGIPYIALTPHSQFLGKVLAAANQPKVMTFKDVISSTSFELMNELLLTAAGGGAERIVVSQSLGVSRSCPMIDFRYTPESELFAKSLSVSVPLMLTRDLGSIIHADPGLLATTSQLQANRTFYLLLLDLAYQNFRDIAAVHGLPHSRAHISAASCELAPSQARDFLAQYYPEFVDAFDSRDFNTIRFGPLHFQRRIADGVKRDGLRVESHQYHLEVSRSDFSERSRLFGMGGVSVVNVDPLEGIAGFRHQRFIPTPELAMMLGSIECRRISADTISDEAYRVAQEAGAKFAVGFVFKVLGEELETPLLRSALRVKDAHLKFMQDYGVISR